MSIHKLWDARQLNVFSIEREAARYIPAVGLVAWAVYTYLVHYATHAGRPVQLPQRSVLAEHCGVTEDEVDSALLQLARYRLLEIADERRHPDSTIRVYRIVGLKPRAVPPEQPARAIPASETEEKWLRDRNEGLILRQMFDAVLEAPGYEDEGIDEAMRDEVLGAVLTIRAAGGDANQIAAAARLYQRLVPDLPLTPHNLAAAWQLLSAALAENANSDASRQSHGTGKWN